MSTVEDLIVAMIEFIRTANGLTTEPMLHADRSELKAQLPFLTLKIISPDQPVGLTPWLRYAADDTLTITGARTAVCSVQGFGKETYSWLENAELALSNPDIIELNHSNQCTVRCMGGMRDLTGTVDTWKEPRYARDFGIDYHLISDPISFSPVLSAQLINIRLERYAGAPDAIVDTITVTF